MQENSNCSVASNNHLAFLDGLRAIAVLAVVGFHLFPEIIPGGFVGVDIFFVISGFLISSHINQNISNKNFSLKAFYASRIRRIFPALIVVLIFCLISGWIILTPSEYKQLAKHIEGGVGFVDNLVLWKEHGYFDNDAKIKPLLHLWSLGIEEQFYIFWPLLLLISVRKNLKHKLILCILVVSFLYNLQLARQDSIADFYSPFSRLWELGLGGACAFLLKNKYSPSVKISAYLSWSGLTIIVMALIITREYDPYPSLRALLPTIGAALIIIGAQSGALSLKFISSRLFCSIGLISYPLYLWHWPILVFLRILDAQEPSVSARFIILCTSLVLASLTYFLVETPFRFGRLRNPAVAILCYSMIGIFAFAVVIKKNDGFQLRQAKLMSADPGSITIGFDRDHVVPHCGLSAQDMEQLYWCLDDPRQPPSQAIIGDSKAEALFYGLVRESKPSSRWLLIGSVNIAGDQYMGSPQQLNNAKAYAAILHNKNITTVVLANALRNQLPTTNDTGFIDGNPPPSLIKQRLESYTAVIKNFEKMGKKVVYLVDNPTLPDPTSCISGGLTPFHFLNTVLRRQANPRCTLSYTQFMAGIQPYRHFLTLLQDKNPKLAIYDPTPLLCDQKANVCPMVRNGKFLYSYGDHISDYANSILANDMSSKGYIY